MRRLRSAGAFVRNDEISSTNLSKGDASDVILTVVTICRSKYSSYKRLSESILQQSLRHIQWLVVYDERSIREEELQFLKTAGNTDSRIILLENRKPQKRQNSEQIALLFMKSHPSKYFTIVEENDYYELTALEKCVLALEANTEFHLCGFQFTLFGQKNLTWNKGFYQSIEKSNEYSIPKFVTSSTVLLGTNCGGGQTGLQSWEFVLCAAEIGHFGFSLPEILVWQNAVSDNTLNENTHLSLLVKARKMYANVKENISKGISELSQRSRYVPIHRIRTGSFFKNDLKFEKSVLMIFPSLKFGQKSIIYLNLVEELVSQNFHVTIICTYVDNDPRTMGLRNLFMQYTHDIFVMPGMIPAIDTVRFFRYILRSRGTDLVFLSQSQLAYSVLPSLSVQFKNVRFVSYIDHTQLREVQRILVPFGETLRSHLDYIFVPSSEVKKYLVDSGCSRHSVKVIHSKDLSGPKYSNMMAIAHRNSKRVKYGFKKNDFIFFFLNTGFPSKWSKILESTFVEALKIWKRSTLRKSEFNSAVLLVMGDSSWTSERTFKVRGVRIAVRSIPLSDGHMIEEFTRLSNTLLHRTSNNTFSLYSFHNTSSSAVAQRVIYEMSNILGDDNLQESAPVRKTYFGNLDQLPSELAEIISEALSPDDDPCGSKYTSKPEPRTPSKTLLADAVSYKSRRIPGSSDSELIVPKRLLSFIVEEVGWVMDYCSVHDRVMQGRFSTLL
ncbi:hypothetical protein BWQ96_08315 [Gracilariopsis chorda]|uniref:Glycosyltransferase 2-like domain-containing protein n=1 Tax=Gracilariopsis chorda TaxID=448386 RepID=A0A2V3IIR0_9FLOR|nr:hypothetical protein BWQ96_08315 [Gracilariopsis chorda]|eukprot:PXF41961.1 hypothetical protein BWQ96_08315 [Gracilariopsis chorda]